MSANFETTSDKRQNSLPRDIMSNNLEPLKSIFKSLTLAQKSAYKLSAQKSAYELAGQKFDIAMVAHRSAHQKRAYELAGQKFEIAMATQIAEAQKSVNIDCYAPCPQTTFLPGPQRKNIICAICHDSRLQLSARSDKDKDTTPAQLPCGHVFGLKCLSKWLSTNSQCPICQFKLKYPGCGHAIPLRTLDQENIRSIPATLPLKGVLPQDCRDCLKNKEGRQQTFVLAVDQLKRLYGKDQTEQNHEQLLLQIDRLKQFVAEGFEKRW